MGIQKADETLNSSTINGSQPYDELVKYVTPIAKPLAPKKLTKKLYKCVKKAKGNKENFIFGVKTVQKVLRRNPGGIAIFAGDVEPIDLICHLPIVCEDKNIPYCFVPSHKELGTVANKQSIQCVLIKKNDAYGDTYDECLSGIRKLPQLA